jgi:hypothetical protein
MDAASGPLKAVWRDGSTYLRFEHVESLEKLAALTTAARGESAHLRERPGPACTLAPAGE